MIGDYSDLAFDDTGRPVRTVGFKFPGEEEEPSEDELQKYREEVVHNLVIWLAKNSRTPHQLGTKVMVIANVLEDGSRKELAQRLGVSRQRVHQILTRAKRELAFLQRLGTL